jgi:hypothetical protein
MENSNKNMDMPNNIYMISVKRREGTKKQDIKSMVESLWLGKLGLIYI